MRDFYVAANGSDTNDGSLTAPFKSLDKVNAVLVNATVDTRFRFRRGDTFYGVLRPPTNLNPANPGWLRFGAYGDTAAPLPVISGYKVLNTASGWTQHDANTWKVDCAAGNVGVTYTGCGAVAESGDGDVGLLKVNGTIQSGKKKTVAELAQQWDHCSQGTVLYVRSTANPTTLATDIRGTFDLHGVHGNSCTEYTDLHIEGYGACGIYIGKGVLCNRVRIIGCEINDIGGCYLDGYADGATRYGNGIVCWTKTSNVHAENNIVHDVWDSPFTIQGGTAGQPGSFENILWRRNLAYRCSQAEEHFYSGTGPGFVNCKSEYNTYIFMGYGFGAFSRPETHTRVGTATYGWGDNNAVSNDLTIRRNIYWDMPRAYCFVGNGAAFANGTPPGLKSDNNVILLRPGTRMQWGVNTSPAFDFFVETAAEWSAVTGRERNSQFHILPASTDTDISDADVRAAIESLNTLVPTGQQFGGGAIPIHAPWR